MIQGLTLDAIMQMALAFVVGGGATAVIAKRTVKTLASTGAEIDVVELLRTEVRRLSEANDRLQSTVDKLQQELFNLREENAELRTLLHPSHSKHRAVPDPAETP